MPVNERYPLADVLDACRADHARRRRTVFVEYVMLAGVNDRYEQALAARRLLSPREAFKVNLIPYNPTDSQLRGLRPRGDRRVPRRARVARRAGHGAPDARARDRRRLRPARGRRGGRLSELRTLERHSAVRRGRAQACSAPDGPRRAPLLRRDAGARLAGGQQPVAQRALLLRRRVPLRDVGQLLGARQPEDLQEQRRRAVDDGAELASARSPRSGRGPAARRPASRR